MKEYHKNPRKITEKRLAELKANIEELGDISGITHDLNTDEIIAGNQRSKAIDINACEIEIIERYEKPDRQGTVAYGYILYDGQRLNYRQVRWDEKQREKANITANALGGAWDLDIINQEWDIDMIQEWGVEKSLFAEYTDVKKHKREVPKSFYTNKIISPIYEPNDKLPKVSELTNLERYKQLCDKITASLVPDEVKAFLLLAACRHIVFSYDKIADFYANSEKEIQELMEDSSLVIIDFKKAVELGYIRLEEEIKEQLMTEQNES